VHDPPGARDGEIEAEMPRTALTVKERGSYAQTDERRSKDGNGWQGYAFVAMSSCVVGIVA